MSKDTIDFRLGWRWLIPQQSDIPTVLCGLNSDEKKYLSEVLTVGSFLFRNCHYKNKYDAAQSMCVVVNRCDIKHWRTQMVHSFPCVREYGLLPASKPRVAVPLSSPKHTLVGMALHRPGRWVARLGLWFARMMVRVGNYSLLRGRVLLIATRDSNFIPLGAMQAGLSSLIAEYGLDYALYFGTPDDNRKTVILPLGASQPDVILKMASLPKARSAVLNEAATLELLTKLPVSNCVPKFFGLVESGDTVTLYQEYRPRRNISEHKMADAVVSFLGQMTNIDRKSVPLSHALVDLKRAVTSCRNENITRACHAILGRLNELALAEAEVWVHRSHGDFAPWNCAWTAKGLFVYDWEESCEQALALSDAFYFAVSPVLLVHRRPSAIKALGAGLRLADKVARTGGLSVINARVYLALWLLARVGSANLYDEMLVLLDKDWR